MSSRPTFLPHFPGIVTGALATFPWVVTSAVANIFWGSLMNFTQMMHTPTDIEILKILLKTQLRTDIDIERWTGWTSAKYGGWWRNS